MLVLKRKEGQWVQVTHAASGDVLRIRVYDITNGLPPRANLAFDDSPRNFILERPERVPRPSDPETMTRPTDPEDLLRLAESA